jgi:hypothetical protein
MGHSGKAFAKPLPFDLGTNDHLIRYGSDSTGLGYAAAIGMKWYRTDVPWNSGAYGGTPIEGLPGVYSSTAITNLVAVVNAVKAAGLKNMLCMCPFTSPGLCPTLASPLASGTVYTSLNLTAIPYAIALGDSIEVITPSSQSTTQTFVAAANMAAGASGALTVTGLSANANYANGCWIYDTAWVACTPQHYASMMGYVVAQSGLQGLDWEGPNEPDGTLFPITSTLLAQLYVLTYAAMKAADPTCTVHGLVLESAVGAGFGYGLDYYNAFITAMVAFGGFGSNNPAGRAFDALSLHLYNINTGYTTNSVSPWTYGGYLYPLVFLIANFQSRRIAVGDTTPMMITECGWQNSTGSQGTTNQQQAQWLQDLLTGLSGNDPVNGGLISAYLTAVFNFDMYQDGAWAIIAGAGSPYPAVAVLTELVSGH